MRQAPATTTDSSAQDPGYTSLPYRSDIDGLPGYSLDIRLQGENESVFFDI